MVVLCGMVVVRGGFGDREVEATGRSEMDCGVAVVVAGGRVAVVGEDRYYG